ncbi:alpha-L-rhamnosidase [Halorhabdus amylolytica]|uniref:alpha-L-rhamnosidase n=1 Tax=Halorhabdus amylolytica TaxID=2559573 RepID=UPI0020C04BF1|nr:alpha-L-rhamnosidase [Halorhabdus amylolytica]
MELRVEFEATPENVDPTAAPRFSWTAETDRRGAHQTAYRLVVGRESEPVAAGEGDLWDTGRVDTSRATGVRYDGPRLGSDETYYWSVKLWTDDGETAWAKPAAFSTALAPEDWHGEWISHQPGVGDSNGWRSQWLDPDESTTEWVQVDLGDRYDLSSVTLHPTEPIDLVTTPDDVTVAISWTADPLDGFGFPDAYRIEVADEPNFEDPTLVVEHEPDVQRGFEGDGQPDDSVPTQTHESLDVRGRYIRITATELHEFTPVIESPFHEDRDVDRRVERVSAWECFALGGLTVEDGSGTDIAEGCDVEASSSVETRTWGRDHLVNGHDGSRMASSSPQLRTEFDLDRSVASARIHVAALGYGELFVNGERIGDRRLDPAWTDYEQRVLYSSFDLTDELSEGKNALGLWLGRGRFSKSSAYWSSDGSPRARATLTIEFEDGSTRTLSTHGGWQASSSPIVSNDLYEGETYDARREVDSWSRPGLDADWDTATVVDGPDGTLRPERIEPMRVVETLDVETVIEHPDGPILDFGQNITGWLSIDIEGSAEGEEITLRHAETLTEDGDLSLIDLRKADATDTYISRGDGIETYEPRFTYHGFRYAQISGYPGEFDPENVTAKVVHTAMDRRGEFTCSNDDLNQVQHNAVWGLRGNAHSIPEDCPQRDERFGWTGDAQIATRSLLFNFDGARFHEKWARDHEDAATEMGYVPDVIPNKSNEDVGDPTWTVTRVMLPWYLYLHDGDQAVLREHYEGMREYVEYWSSSTEDGLVPDQYGKYGDWLTFENADGRRGLPHDLFNTAFVYQIVDTFAKVADTLGNETDRENYRERAIEIADAFNEEFFDPEAGVYGPGTQSSYSVPLFLGLVPEANVDLVAENLAEKVRSDGGKLQSGFLGTRPLIHTLAEHGYADLAYQVVSQPEQPGWVYMVRQGATTMWERWNSDEEVGSGMNSLNHSPFTHVSEFFYEVLAGIKLEDDPVTESVTIAPSLVEDLEWVSASVETPTGTLAVDWEREDDSYQLTATVPWNVNATIRLPDGADASVIESAKSLSDGAPDGVRSVERDGDDLVLSVGAGEYEFSVA